MDGREDGADEVFGGMDGTFGNVLAAIRACLGRAMQGDFALLPAARTRGITRLHRTIALPWLPCCDRFEPHLTQDSFRSRGTQTTTGYHDLVGFARSRLRPGEVSSGRACCKPKSNPLRFQQ